MNGKLILKRADESDIDAVVNLYESVKGSVFCPWNEFYPTADNARADQAAECLYVLTLGDDVIGCVSVEPEAEDDDLGFWHICDGTHREIARVAVSPDHQGKGLAKIMVGLLIDELKREGIRSIHLLAAKKNPPAVHTYRSLGFDFLGECFRYGNDYFVCEKIL